MKTKYFWLVGSFVALAAAIALLLTAFPFWVPNPETEQLDTITTAPQTTATVSSTPTNVTDAYVSPIPFAELQAVNPDIYAWIKVPGTNIDYPVVQHASDDSFYLDHNSVKDPHPNGAIFTERTYNSKDFTDAVTVLYGHDMLSGDMFGKLQSLYSDRDFLLENDEIIIYLPDRELRFEIFAALPYSRMHLLYYYHTEKQRGFDRLIDDVYDTRKLSAILLEDRRPAFGDQVVVLSTCMAGDNRYRYLVMGVCKDNG